MEQPQPVHVRSSSKSPDNRKKRRSLSLSDVHKNFRLSTGSLNTKGLRRSGDSITPEDVECSKLPYKYPDPGKSLSPRPLTPRGSKSDASTAKTHTPRSESLKSGRTRSKKASPSPDLKVRISEERDRGQGDMTLSSDTDSGKHKHDPHRSPPTPRSLLRRSSGSSKSSAVQSARSTEEDPARPKFRLAFKSDCESPAVLSSSNTPRGRNLSASSNESLKVPTITCPPLESARKNPLFSKRKDQARPFKDQKQSAFRISFRLVSARGISPKFGTYFIVKLNSATGTGKSLPIATKIDSFRI